MYVILSRVKSLSGLYLLEPLDTYDKTLGQIPCELVQHNEHLPELESSVLEQCRIAMARICDMDGDLTRDNATEEAASTGTATDTAINGSSSPFHGNGMTLDDRKI